MLASEASALREVVLASVLNPFIIKSLWIDPSIFETIEDAKAVIPAIFNSCPHLTRLALSEPSFLALVDAASTTINRNLHEADLDVTVLGDPLYHALTFPNHDEFLREQGQGAPYFFHRITHLYLHSEVYPGDVLHLVHYTRLTHFAAYLPATADHLSDIISSATLLTTLQFFLAIIPADWHPASKDDAKNRVRKARETDSRVYYLECSDIFGEWKANGGKSLWERAIGFTKNISGE
jgi:hypothetical protein